ncbi:PREDICTED: protein patched [Nicrophorus vespilloides]|uniref:Protein patched n=1 Tax=Nicrophorus vespilloides TaxID=110193 RepID=A0ABM1M7S4_NICVS|nr:PREDICTED: protein patched [Nicrophorus vespilloides]
MATTESQVDTERHKSDLYTRPGWVDAYVALEQIEQGKAIGDRGVLWVRVRLQRQVHSLGRFLDAHAGKVLFVALLVITTFCVGLKSSTFHSDIEQLWAEAADDAATATDDSPPPEILSTHQMVVQTAVDPDASLLHPNGLLEHLHLIRKASQVTVTMFDITWRLKDICQSPNIPNFDIHYVEQMFENVMPCSIVTPLDCFWEGSKLLGPDYPVHIPYGIGNEVKWTNLNPQKLVQRIKQKESNFDYHSLEDYFKRAGISSGYQEKPCLNPKDPACPATAPNHNSSHPVDIGAELTNGCYGFAAKYMHWPEDLIVGGAVKNKTGHIRQAKALQTVVQLMGEHELFKYYSETYKVHHIGWNHDKAASVLRAWQKRFSQEVDHLSRSNTTSSHSFNTFSTATLNKGLAEHSQINFVELGAVLIINSFYSWVAHSGLAALCVLILASSTAAGLGVSSLLGLPMNLLSTKVLPYVSVGLSMMDVFLLLTTYNKKLGPPDLLQRVGPSIITSAARQAAVFLAAALIPVPALRVFCLQFAIVTIFHSAATVLVFPTLIALEMRCKRSAVPCFRNESRGVPTNNNLDRDHEANLLTSEYMCNQRRSVIMWIINKYLTVIIFKPMMKVLLCISYLGLVVFCIFNGLKVEYDVRLSSFLPKNTQEYHYLEAQNRYFGFYNFYLVTTELEYPLSQPILHEYHSSLTQVPHVLKDSNGGLNNNDFWLSNFREFLVDLQDEFNKNRNQGCLNSEKWFANATEKAVLAFKLLAQTGIVEFPVDKLQIFNKKLVESGIIDPKAFYNYLSVWSSNDEISYSSSQANLMPKPFQYYSAKNEYDLKIPKSQPLTYTQMPFYLKNLRSTGKIIDTLKKILSISESFNNRGLKNYPIGLIFSYFRQFLFIDRLLAIQLTVSVLSALVITCILVHWSKLVCPMICTLCSMLVLCFVNINGLTGTVGALHFIIVFQSVMLIMLGFQNALGGRERRIRLSVEMYAEIIIKGHLGLLICIAVLATSQFEFIYQMFRILFVSICISTVNSMVFFLIMLSIFGPKGELQGLQYVDRIATPPPKASPPAPVRTSSYTKQSRRSAPTKATREPSLTTITEESCNQSIVVEPQVTVEYSSPESTSSGGQYTTKVTATANIKVELVTPVYRSKCGKHHSQSSSSSRSKHSKRHSQCKCCKNDTDSDSSGESQETGTENSVNS